MKLIIFEVISITIDLEVLITIGGYTKVTLREVPQYETRHCNSAIKILTFRFLVNAFNIISRQGKCTEGIFRKEGNSGRINSINTYVKWGTAYRAGGANSRSVTFRPFGDEEVSSWEIGAKTELFDRRARFNIAAFHTRYRDRQVTFPNPANPSSNETVNAEDPAIIKGIEVDLMARVAPGLTLSGSYAYTDWKASTDYNPVLGVSQQGAITYTPKHSVSLSLDHELPLFDDVTLASHVDVIHSGSFYSQGLNHPKTDAYTVPRQRQWHRFEVVN